MSSKKYKGTLELNWINKDKSLIYEYDDDGNPTKPQWVERNDIRVSEPRILKLKGEYGDPNNENMLIKGDNLLALRTLVEEFKNREEKDKVKCIYIDPPFNTGAAFDHYDDNLEHSEWLTMMRDRLKLLRPLLRQDGFIAVHLDEKEMAHCKVLMDEIFGRVNYLNTITISATSPFGFKHTSSSVFSVSNYVLIYAKDKGRIRLKKIYKERNYDRMYDLILLNPDNHYSEWIWDKVENVFSKENGFGNAKEAIKTLGKDEYDKRVTSFVIENASTVFRIAAVSGGALAKRKKTVEESKKNKNKVFTHPNDDMGYYFLNGGRVLFYDKRLVDVEGKKVPGEVLTDVWTDISWMGIAKEGNVVFPKGKKPEKLIKRVIEMSTRKGDLVLDSFAGSGTTGAVAHKMGRRWIMVELGKHAETHCLKRLKSVIDKENPDKTGVSNDADINWNGGGFRFYVLGDSLLKDHDINWGLEQEEIARALFMNFDYGFDGSLEDGVFVGRRGHRYGLCLVSKDVKILYAEKIGELIEQMNEKFDDLADLEIYTNMGVGVRREDLPENVTVKKIPESILRKYRL